MALFKIIWALLQSILALAIIALSVDHYNPTLISYQIPEFIEQLCILGVFGVALFWVLVHLIGGGLLGMAAQGMTDGVKMGLLLGIGTGAARLWPHTLAWGIGCFAASGPVSHIILMGVTSGILFGLNSCLKYFWGNIQNGAFSGE